MNRPPEVFAAGTINADFVLGVEGPLTRGSVEGPLGTAHDLRTPSTSNRKS